MRAVNLLPRDEPKKSFEANRGVVVGAAGGVPICPRISSAVPSEVPA